MCVRILQSRCSAHSDSTWYVVGCMRIQQRKRTHACMRSSNAGGELPALPGRTAGSLRSRRHRKRTVWTENKVCKPTVTQKMTVAGVNFRFKPKRGQSRENTRFQAWSRINASTLGNIRYGTHDA